MIHVVIFVVSVAIALTLVGIVVGLDKAVRWNRDRRYSAWLKQATWKAQVGDVVKYSMPMRLGNPRWPLTPTVLEVLPGEKLRLSGVPGLVPRSAVKFLRRPAAAQLSAS